MKILITGRSGTGKSTICHELVKQGYASFDSDGVAGLSSWIDAKTGEPVRVDYSKPIDRFATHWNWDKTILEDLLVTSDDLFLCGSADNQFDFHDLFDKVFVLTLPPETQHQRILDRTEHDYGKLPVMQEQILAEQKEFAAQAITLGAVPINAVSKPAEIVKKIVSMLHED